MLNIYRASAGSGKTYRLTQDYIHLLFDPQRERVHRRIMAVTFTNKATDEMKTRILKELYALSQGEESNYRTGLMAEFRMDEEAINRKAKHILTTILHDYSSFPSVPLTVFSTGYSLICPRNWCAWRLQPRTG